jgi:hypothetical protein
VGVAVVVLVLIRFILQENFLIFCDYTKVSRLCQVAWL